MVVMHSINTHQTDFSSISTLNRAAGYMDHLMKEATEYRKFHDEQETEMATRTEKINNVGVKTTLTL
jgi:hypothetical protein